MSWPAGARAPRWSGVRVALNATQAEGHLRFSYANSIENINEGMRRLAEYVRGRRQ